MSHYQVLVNVEKLKSLDAVSFCKDVGVFEDLSLIGLYKGISYLYKELADNFEEQEKNELKLPI